LRAGDPGKSATSMFSIPQLAGLLTLESIRVETEKYYDENGAVQNIIPAGDIYGFYAQNGGSRYDPSNLKTFTSGDWRVFTRQLEAVTLVTVSHYSDIVCTDKNGLVRMEIL